MVGWRGWGGITPREMPDVEDVGGGGWRQQTTMACMYLCNNPAGSSCVPQSPMRIHGHRKGSTKHWGLLGGKGEGQWEGEVGRDSLGRHAKCG